MRLHIFLFGVQDHPEHGVLYLVRGVLNMVQDYTWEESSDAKVRVYISALPLLAAMSQETYLYTIPKSESTLSARPCLLLSRCFVCTVLQLSDLAPGGRKVEIRPRFLPSDEAVSPLPCSDVMPGVVQ